MDIEKLVKLDGEKLEDAFSLVDWREYDSEVARLFAAQLGSDTSLKVQVDHELVLLFEGKEYSVPLTKTGSDRYVVLSSCAELVKDSHDVWLHKESLENDTHGFLITSKSQSRELQDNHADWVAKHLEPLTLGFDYFGEVEIPYLNHSELLASFSIETPEVTVTRYGQNKAHAHKSVGEKFKSVAKSFAKNVLLPLAAILVMALAWAAYLKLTKA